MTLLDNKGWQISVISGAIVLLAAVALFPTTESSYAASDCSAWWGCEAYQLPCLLE